MSEIKKEAQGRKLKNILAPIRFLGKKFLGARSEIYSEALRTIEKADDIIRDATYKQKVYLKDMKSQKNKLQGSRFAQTSAAFLREQELILQIVSKIQTEFGNITGNPSVTDINSYINNQIGLSPEYGKSQKVEDKLDIEEEWMKERPGYIGRILEYGVKPTLKRFPGNEPYGITESTRKKSMNEFDGLIKTALLEGWYWKKTKSGKEYAKSFDVVYDSLKNLFDKNVKLLEKLDDVRSIGDPQEYYQMARNPKDGFFAITDKQLKNDKFVSSWDKFNKFLIEQDIEPPTQEIKQTVKEKFQEPAKETPTIEISDIKEKLPEVPELIVPEKEKPVDLEDEYQKSIGLLPTKRRVLELVPESEPESFELPSKTLVKEPGTLVSEPKTLVSEPGTLVREPRTLVKEPDTLVSEPRTLIREPKSLSDTEVYTPTLKELKHLETLKSPKLEEHPKTEIDVPTEVEPTTELEPPTELEPQTELEPLTETSKDTELSPMTMRSPSFEPETEKEPSMKYKAHKDSINDLIKMSKNFDNEETKEYDKYIGLLSTAKAMYDLPEYTEESEELEGEFIPLPKKPIGFFESHKAIPLKLLKEKEQEELESEQNSMPSEIENVPQLSAHNKFIESLIKMSNDNASEKDIALFMLSYANEIDKTDSNYALKLTAIAEGIL